MESPLLLVSGATMTPRGPRMGHLIVPRQWSRSQVAELQPGRWAIDNGAFSGKGFEPGAYVRLLERFYHVPGCLFATAPDVVGDAAATLDAWPFWSRLLRGLGFPVALVGQDGLSADRLPWMDCDALFIGGTDAFKDSTEVVDLCAVARARGKWIHWGRVNGRRRYGRALRAGCDSFDGTGFSMYPDVTIPKVTAWHHENQQQHGLGFTGSSE